MTDAFDHPDWLFELKYDGFRVLAHVDAHQCSLVSRNGHAFKHWDVLRTEISHGVRAHSAVLDGEIVCLDDDGRPDFHKLLFRREWPYFFAFDVLSIDGEDLTALSLLARKRRLRAILPRIESRLRYVDHVKERGQDLFREVCSRDLEGIVAKCSSARYFADGVRTSWIKIKNPTYSQMEGLHKLFVWRNTTRQHRASRAKQPVFAID